MNILLLLIFGALVGWIASLVMGSNHRQGLIMDIVLGVVGSIVGGWIMSLFGEQGVTGFDLYSLIVGVIGAVILIYLGRMLTSASQRV
jgi:uncharacterized membrane protein YeaQ/YmgE (transglycosylase-associated protein family)